MPAEARQDYLRSSAGFQKAAGFKDRDGSSAPRLDGVALLASNLNLWLSSCTERCNCSVQYPAFGQPGCSPAVEQTGLHTAFGEFSRVLRTPDELPFLGTSCLSGMLQLQRITGGLREMSSATS